MNTISTNRNMYIKNVLLGSNQDKTNKKLLPTSSESLDQTQKIDMVTVLVPEHSSEGQQKCKSLAALMSTQDYQNYMPVYQPLSHPLAFYQRKKPKTCTLTGLIVTLIFFVLLLIVSVILLVLKYMYFSDLN